MNCAGKHFLTRSIFTNEQYCRTRGRHGPCLLNDFIERLATTQQIAEPLGSSQLIAQPAILDLQTTHARCLTDDVQHFRAIERLFKESVCSSLHSLNRSCLCLASCNDNHLDRRIFTASRIDYRQPFRNIVGTRRQMEITYYDVNVLAMQQR